MPLPIRIVCASCGLEELHQYVSGKWFSVGCKAEWTSEQAAKRWFNSADIFARENSHRRRGTGGYHQVSRYARMKR